MTEPAPVPSPGRRRAERTGRAGRRDQKRAARAATAADTASRSAGTRRSAQRRRGLGSPTLPRPSLRSRGWRWGLIGCALVLVGSWFSWYATTPTPLPRTDETVNAAGIAGKPIYLGMFSGTDGFDRTLRVAGVRVHATASAALKITPLLCRQGAVGVTTDPAQFCNEIVNPEGQRLAGGDSIMLEVETDQAAIAVIDQIRIAYREDLTWGTQPAGAQQAIVTMAQPGPTGTP